MKVSTDGKLKFSVKVKIISPTHRMATYQIPAPQQMSLKGDLDTNWRIFKENWEDYLVATGLDKKDKKIQAATLKSVMGNECKERLSALELTEEELKDPDVIIAKLKEYFAPHRNEMYDREIFNDAKQQANETVDQFLHRLRKLARPCKWENQLDNMLRDRLVHGCCDPHARARAYRKTSCTLKDAIEILRISETTNKQLKTLVEGEVQSTSREKQNSSKRAAKQQQQRKPAQQQQQRYTTQQQQRYTTQQQQRYTKQQQQSRSPEKQQQQRNPTPQQQRNRESCTCCGRMHEFKKFNTECPAYGITCHKCGRQGHFKAFCTASYRANSSTGKPHSMKKMDAETEETVEDNYNEESDDSAFKRELIETVGSVQANDGKLMIPLKMETSNGNTCTMQCEIDTGTSCNIMSRRTLQKMENKTSPHIQPSRTKLRMYNGDYLTVLGETEIKCVYRGQEYDLNFIIVATDEAPTQAPLLSRSASMEMKLIEVSPDIVRVNHIQKDGEQLVKQYNDVFEGIGCLPGDYMMDVDETIKPVQDVPRRVPVPLKAKLKEKIDDLVKTGIITKVTEPTPWISSMVSVLKPGKLRVFLDPCNLNKAIRRSHYPMPTVDDHLPDLANAKVFTVLDCKDGFHQVRLTEESSKLTCFWTPFGRYRYLRMPFGINSAHEEWQRRIHEIIHGLPGVIAIADDILVYGCGETEEEYMKDHHRNLQRLLQKARDVNLKFNKKKMRLCMTEVGYMGHLLTSEGIKSDPAKVQAIVDMPRPENKSQVQTLIGCTCINYLSRYLPRLATVSEPLRQLTEKDAIFVWQSSQEESFQQIKEMLISAPVLKYYDLTQEVTIQSDGLGGTIMQNGQPVAFASRALTKTEQNYAQIEKEALAIVFSCERFNQYIHGRELITVKTDHKPLVPIFKKSIHQAPKRLQRMMLRLQKYNLDIQYQPGPEMFIADCLSRNFLKTKVNSETSAYQIFKIEREDKLFQEIADINQVEYLNAKEDTIAELQQETAKDPTLQQLKQEVLTGWRDRNQVPEEIRQFYGYRDEITVQNGILYKGMRIIVPESLQQQMLKKVHSSHQGIDASKRRAKDVLFWPGMAAQITDTISTCTACNTFQDKQQKEPMMSYEIPKCPWSILSQDLMSYDSETYLITVDHYSDFFEIDNITEDTRSEAIIKCTKEHCSRHGRADKIITDNGPQFVSSEYEKFMKSWKTEHVTISLHHSQSNEKLK